MEEPERRARSEIPQRASASVWHAACGIGSDEQENLSFSQSCCPISWGARLLRQLRSTWVLHGFLLAPDCYGSCCAPPGFFAWASSHGFFSHQTAVAAVVLHLGSTHGLLLALALDGISSCARLLRRLQHGRLLRQLQHMRFIFRPAPVQHAHPRVACAFCRWLPAALKALAYLGCWARHKTSHAILATQLPALG